MKLALTSFRILYIIYFVLTAVLILTAFIPDIPSILAPVAFVTGGIGYFIMRVRTGLTEGKYWAWISGIIISGLVLLSAFFPLGIMGLMGLLNEPTRRAFNEPKVTVY